MKRYIQLFTNILKYKYIGEMAFNSNFIINVLVHMTWIVIPVCFYSIIYSKTTVIAGWSYQEVLLLIGTFQIFEGINQLTYFRGVFFELASSIHSGSLDFLLLKPANSQFLISFKAPDIFGITDFITGTGLCIWAAINLNIPFSIVNVLLYILLLMNGVLINYTIFFLLSISAFFTIKGSDLLEIFDSAIDESITKPVGIYAKRVRFIFTYILPVFIMISLPVKAIISKITIVDCVLGIIGSSVLLAISAVVWKISLKRYSSASS